MGAHSTVVESSACTFPPVQLACCVTTMKTACVLLLAVAAAVCLTGASATKGVDVSSDVYIGDWKVWTGWGLGMGA